VITKKKKKKKKKKKGRRSESLPFTACRSGSFFCFVLVLVWEGVTEKKSTNKSMFLHCNDHEEHQQQP
jgi:hypothetical protein